MEQITVHIVHAFDINGTGGNPAGVVLNDDTFSAKEKQHIARKVGLSETTFISKSPISDFKLEFFTPNKQIAHCGHATVASFSLLREKGLIGDDRSSKETIDGTRNIHFDGDKVFMEQAQPVFTRLEIIEDRVFDALGITRKDLATNLRPMKVSTGNAFVVVPLKSVDLLASLTPDSNAIIELSKHLGLVGLYPFVLGDDGRVDAQARMFAPLYGIPEEAATGMAAGPLACYLHSQVQPKDQFVIKQGEFMEVPSPSLIYVQLNLVDGDINNLFAGGTAYTAKQLDWLPK
ncbi:PhzF family phenazine biosynthesis protein [Allomuricauda sp. NBRC 101325]|uniref:PhzF family phenazine biosynthesis protein n=1 Tax=Allomuricauda sp. NBRC 101325 TaxID=1113758 RepID=UPI0024A2CEC4|nr:PhzF family phenazine biosynthesis protein [Muricauda sp. NBRC 101325]GLU45245.1 phenazine biosynthesis protein PhzF [Muricauda sp. NBRC 101325]